MEPIRNKFSLTSLRVEKKKPKQLFPPIKRGSYFMRSWQLKKVIIESDTC